MLFRYFFIFCVNFLVFFFNFREFCFHVIDLLLDDSHLFFMRLASLRSSNFTFWNSITDFLFFKSLLTKNFFIINEIGESIECDSIVITFCANHTFDSVLHFDLVVFFDFFEFFFSWTFLLL